MAGVYYIHSTIGVLNYRSKLELMRNINELPVMNVKVELNATFTFVTSRAIILRLERYEEMYIRLPFGYEVFSNRNKYVSFSGFRIYV